MSEVARRLGRPTADEAVELRQRILDETLKVLRVGGAERLSLDYIAAQADVTKRTIYRHFEDKAGLIDAVVDQEIDRLEGLMTGGDGVAASPVEELRSWAKRFFELSCAPETTAFSNYLCFEAGADPALQPKQRRWYSRMIGHVCELIETAQTQGALARGPSQRLALLLIDLITGPVNRRRMLSSDGEIFAGDDAESFFASRWIAFLSLAGGGVWLEWERRI